MAEGATWTVAIAGPPPAGDPTVVSAIQEGAATRYRLVAKFPPPGAVAAEPGLEDGYVALMRRTRA